MAELCRFRKKKISHCHFCRKSAGNLNLREALHSSVEFYNLGFWQSS